MALFWCQLIMMLHKFYLCVINLKSNNKSFFFFKIKAFIYVWIFYSKICNNFIIYLSLIKIYPCIKLKSHVPRYIYTFPL